jgi:hypothetical protein
MREVSIYGFEIESSRALVCPGLLRVEKWSPNKPPLIVESGKNALEMR